MKHLTWVVLAVILGAPGSDRETGWRLVDPGFEAPQLAALPLLGWYSDDASLERVTSAADAEDRLEGEHSLVVTLLEPRPQGRGRASISQTVRRTSARAARDLEFSIALKSRGLSEVLVHFYVWDEDHVARQIAEKPLRLNQADWTHYALAVSVPAGHDEFGVFLYLPNEKGGRLWLDQASLSAR